MCDPDSDKINELCQRLIGATVELNFSIRLVDGNDISGILENCNIVGDSLENIVYPFIKKHINTFEEGPKQSSPDFWNRDKEFEYEMKAFQGSPGFDIGNFESYINQLSLQGGVNKKLYKTKYMIFKYSLKDGKVKIDDFSMKNVWELVGYGGKYPITIQNKRGMWYNIRPGSYKNIKSLKHVPETFIKNVCDAIQICPNNISCRETLIEMIKQQFYT